MTSSKTGKYPCVSCDRPGLVTCRGCQKDFCIPHISGHREVLNQQMDMITLDHDQLHEAVTQCVANPRDHSLMKRVDEWEKNSIEYVQQMALDARNQILLTMEKQTIRINEALKQLRQQLCRARDDEDFFEADLERWEKQLDELKGILAVPIANNIPPQEQKALSIGPIIFGIVPLADSFERSAGDVRIEDNGQLIVHGAAPLLYATIRGRDEFSWGRHQFRFKIEKCHKGEWMLFGIISRDAPVEEASYLTPSSYGWAGRNKVYINGVVNPSYKNYKTDMAMNDTMSLWINCHDHILRLTNERTKSAYALEVDITKCPFPWQLNLNLYNPSDSVRIIPSEN